MWTSRSTCEVWRAMVLILKAKLPVVEAGITTPEQESLANMALPGDVTVGRPCCPGWTRPWTPTGCRTCFWGWAIPLPPAR